jgi:hypothetical protein
MRFSVSGKQFIAISIVVVVVILLTMFLIQVRGRDRPQIEQKNPYKDADITVEIVPAPNDTYGYNIHIEDRKLIHQPSVPAIPGVEGFKTEEDAMTVGEFVKEKIRNNIFPPSISVKDLDSLGVL